MCSRDEEGENERERESEQIDRKSNCDLKQSQITLVFVSCDIVVWLSRPISPHRPPFL